MHILGSTRFFGQDRVVRVGLEQGFDDRLFDRLVDISDEIVVLLLSNDDPVDIESSAVDDGGAAASSFDRRIEHWVHVYFP